MPIDRGSTVTIEIEFKKRTPFGTTWDYFDPTSPKVTVYNPGGEAVATDAVPTKSAVGKYYYIVQTLVAWMPGKYSTKVTGTDGAYSEVDASPEVFELE